MGKSDCTAEDEWRLHVDLFEKYNTNIRPVKDSATPVTTTVELHFANLKELNVKGQYMDASYWFVVHWKDELLTWNSTAYGQVTKITVSPEKLWLPDLSIMNALERMNDIGGTGVKVIVHSDGGVTWWPGRQFKTECVMDITKYPFDRQTCFIYMSLWYSDDNDILLKHAASHVDLSTTSRMAKLTLLTSRPLNITTLNGTSLL